MQAVKYRKRRVTRVKSNYEEKIIDFFLNCLLLIVIIFFLCRKIVLFYIGEFKHLHNVLFAYVSVGQSDFQIRTILLHVYLVSSLIYVLYEIETQHGI